MIRNLLLGLCFVLSLGAAPQSDRCPTCGGMLMRKPDFKIEWGKMVFLHECTLGHQFWYPDESLLEKQEKEKQKEQEAPGIKSCDCPICHMSGTRKVQIGEVYECINGHEFGCE